MLGAEPAAAQHQKTWHKCGRRYLIEEKEGKQIDRSTAVKTTEDFFKCVEQEILENSTLREMAQKVSRQGSWSFLKHGNNAEQKGDKTMEELFLRNFSSVHVHYVPLEGFKRLGTSEIILRQTSRLSCRIRNDSARVQEARAEAWTRFDSKQLSIVFDHAFKHLSSGSAEPFDFSFCRRHTTLPDSIDGHIAEFLKRSLNERIEVNFSYASSVISSSLVRHALKVEGMGKSNLPLLVSLYVWAHS